MRVLPDQRRHRSGTLGEATCSPPAAPHVISSTPPPGPLAPGRQVFGRVELGHYPRAHYVWGSSTGRLPRVASSAAWCCSTVRCSTMHCSAVRSAAHSRTRSHTHAHVHTLMHTCSTPSSAGMAKPHPAPRVPEKNGQHFPLRSGAKCCSVEALPGSPAKNWAAFPLSHQGKRPITRGHYRENAPRKIGQHFPLREGVKCSLEALLREPREKLGSISP